jgi:hypothetical protein
MYYNRDVHIIYIRARKNHRCYEMGLESFYSTKSILVIQAMYETQVLTHSQFNMKLQKE